MSVLLLYNNHKVKCAISSCTPHHLSLLFHIDYQPRYLFHLINNEKEAIFWEDHEKQWNPLLKENNIYTIPNENNNNHKSNISLLDINIIQQAALCSLAISEANKYNYNNINNDLSSILYKNIKYHSIESICETQIYSPITYGLYFTLSSEKQIYISFRGTTNNDDIIKDLEALSIDKFKGKIHLGFWKRAQLIPLEPFVNYIKEGYTLIFCGHSMGGSVAQLVYLNLIEYYCIFENNIPINKIYSISFGSPFISTIETNTWIKSIQCHNNIINIINNDDFIPRLLDKQSISILSKKNILHLLGSLISTTEAGIEYQPHINLIITAISSLSGLNISQLSNNLTLIQNTISNSIPFLKSLITDYYPLGIYGVFSRDIKTGGNLNFNIYTNPNILVKELTMNTKNINVNQLDNHFMGSYWNLLLELSNNNDIYNNYNLHIYSNTYNDNNSLIKPRIIHKTNRFLLKNNTKVIVTKNEQSNRIKLVLQGDYLCFLDKNQLKINGIPIIENKSGKQKIELLQDPPLSKQAEFQCDLDSEKQSLSYPSIDVITHFDKKTFSISNIQYVDGLSKREKSIDILSLSLFQKVFQRGLSEMILFNNRDILYMLFLLEELTLHSCILSNSLKKDSKTSIISGNEGKQLLIHSMMENHDIIDVLKRLFNYFISSLTLKDKQNKRTYAIYALTGSVVFISTALVTPISLPAMGMVGMTMSGMAAGFGANAIRNKFKAVTEWNNITTLRSMLDEIYVHPEDKHLHNILSYTIEYDCMLLEKAISKKAEPLHILDKSINDLLESSPPIFPLWKDKLNQDSYIKVLERLKASCLLYKIREHLIKQYFLGIVGPQNSGKTTLTNLILGKNISECGDDKHTESANLYKYSNDVIIVDFAGQTSTDIRIANIANQCGSMVSGFIFVTDFRGDPENINALLLEQIHIFNCPILICVNQISRRLDSIPSYDKLQFYKNRWKNYINSYFINIYKENQDDNSINEYENIINNLITIEFTEFRDYSDTLRNIGVKDISIVYEWMNKQLRTLDFKPILFPKSSKLKSQL